MKSIFTILLLTLSLNAFSQKLVKEYYDWNETKIKKEYYTDAYGTLNGSFKAYSEYGGVMKQGQCKNDGPIGKWIENYDNGKLHYIKYYDTPGTNDFQVINGKVFCYYEDGKTLKFERHFKNFELDGVYKLYEENGVLAEDDFYINGKSENERKYDEKQKIEREVIAQKNAEEYKKIIPEADKAYLEKNYKKALELYDNASKLVGNNKLRQIADSNQNKHDLFIKTHIFIYS